MKVLYFAWVRERIGVAEEEVETDGMDTARDLIAALKARGAGYAAAFEKEGAIRVAVDRRMAALDDPIRGAREVAFFPPVTGG